jgi:hypothetical protein
LAEPANPAILINMNNILFILLALTLLAVLATLVVGMVAMSKGGDFNKKYGNKLMRLRVVLQGIALILFVLALLTKGDAP